jgi:hypothetical protein
MSAHGLFIEGIPYTFTLSRPSLKLSGCRQLTLAGGGIREDEQGEDGRS